MDSEDPGGDASEQAVAGILGETTTHSLMMLLDPGLPLDELNFNEEEEFESLYCCMFE